MTKLVVNIEKYYELAALINDGIGIEIGKFHRVYKCYPQLTRGLDTGNIHLIFDEEEDAIWFQLKHL